MSEIGSGPKSSYDADVCVVGAGPVGMITSLLLAKQGLTVLLLEERSQRPGWSRAIGMSPPSLEILENLGLSQSMLNGGHAIRDVVVNSHRSLLGRVNFRNISTKYDCMLSIPQDTTEAILEEQILAQASSITYKREARFLTLEQYNEGLVIHYQITNGASSAQVRMLCGCDGINSAVRASMGQAWRGRRYPWTFVMGDFEDHSDFGPEARLFFTPLGAVESFPLPRNKRRWIVQTASFVENPTKTLIADEVLKRCGIQLETDHLLWQSPFGVQRFAAKTWYKDRVVLLGDAAHILSPIGGQGMNTGIADAHLLSEYIQALGFNAFLAQREQVLKRWQSHRQRDYRVAANRSYRSTRLGTWRGQLPSAVRNALLWLMLNGPSKSTVPADYAMLTLPFRKKYPPSGVSPTLEQHAESVRQPG